MAKYLWSLMGIVFVWSISAAPSTSHASMKMEISRTVYLKKLKIEMQKSLCSEKGLLPCFKISRAECIQTIGSEFGPCAKMQAVPEKISLAGEDLVIAETLGACVSEKLAKKYKNRFDEASECAIRK